MHFDLNILKMGTQMNADLQDFVNHKDSNAKKKTFFLISFVHW